MKYNPADIRERRGHGWAFFPLASDLIDADKLLGLGILQHPRGTTDTASKSYPFATTTGTKQVGVKGHRHRWQGDHSGQLPASNRRPPFPNPDDPLPHLDLPRTKEKSLPSQNHNRHSSSPQQLGLLSIPFTCNKAPYRRKCNSCRQQKQNFGQQVAGFT